MLKTIVTDTRMPCTCGKWAINPQCRRHRAVEIKFSPVKKEGGLEDGKFQPAQMQPGNDDDLPRG